MNRNWTDHFDKCKKIKKIRDRIFQAEIDVKTAPTVDVYVDNLYRNPKELLEKRIKRLRAKCNHMLKTFQDSCWDGICKNHCQ